MLLKITMLFAVTFVIHGFISNVTTSQSIPIENYKMTRNHVTAYLSVYTGCMNLLEIEFIFSTHQEIVTK